MLFTSLVKIFNVIFGIESSKIIIPPLCPAAGVRVGDLLWGQRRGTDVYNITMSSGIQMIKKSHFVTKTGKILIISGQQIVEKWGKMDNFWIFQNETKFSETMHCAWLRVVVNNNENLGNF